MYLLYEIHATYNIFTLPERVFRWLIGVLTVLKNYLVQATYLIKEYLLHVLGNAKDWPVQGLHAIDSLLKEHPYLSLLVFWSIFFGPIVFLLPLIMVQEAFFVVVHSLRFALHGITGGSPGAWYHSLYYEALAPINSLFEFLQSAGTAYNDATTNSRLLLAFRLMAGTVGVYILIEMAMRWW